MKYLPWDAMRRAFEQEGLSCRQIAEKYGAGYSTVTEHARQEGWTPGVPGEAGDRDTGMPALVHRLSDTVLEALESLRQEERPDIKAVKELTVLLRELTNMDKVMESRQTEEAVVRVELAPELEEWSR